MNTNRNSSCYGGPNTNRNMHGHQNQHMNRSVLDGPFPVGMAYVPWQEFKDLYDPYQGLCHGTIFKELDYPFYGKRGNCR